MGDDKPQTPVPPPSLPVYATSGSPAPVPALATAPSMADDTAHAPAGRENSAIPPEVKQEAADVDMTDSPIPTSQAPPQLQQQQQQHSRLTAERSPAPGATTTTSSSTAPRNSTPLRQTNGQDGGSSSRAASQHPESGPGGTGSHYMPAAPVAHGAPVRQYLNQNVTGVLLAGMKEIAQNQPKDPLRVLGEYLLNAHNNQRDNAANTA